jgi:hypothetical protein
MKGIVKDLDKGFYQEARKQNVHPLELLTALVKPEPDEVKPIADRLGRNLAASGMSLGAVAAMRPQIERTAHMFAGLEKELSVRGISGSDTVEQAFFSSTNGPSQPLFPVYLAAKIIAGHLATSLVPNLIAADMRVNSHVQEKVTISDTGTTRALKVVDEGVDLPKVSISRTNGSVSLLKYGKILEASYESIRLLHLDIIGLQMSRIGAQIGIDESDDCLEVLSQGDGNSGTSLTMLSAEVAGVLDYDELVRLFLAFPIGYQMRHAVVNDTLLRTILNMAEFKDAMQGFHFQSTGVLPGPMGATFHRWTSTGSAGFGTDKIIAVDNSAAIIRLQEGDLLEEADRLIDKQIERRSMSQWVGFQKWDNNATQGLDL